MNIPSRRLLAAAVLSSLLLVTACNDDNGNPINPITPTPADSTGDVAGLELKIVHINDHHSHLQPDTGTDLTLGGEGTRVVMGGFPRVVTKINELASSSNNVLKLHAGDAITGDLYYTLFKGEADAALMNEVCFDAFALGNHEFDNGDAGLKTFLDYLASPTCQTPVLAANVVPEVGVSPLTLTSATDYIQPYIIKEVDGVQVGIIGIDIANKTKNSSNPDASTQFLDETTTAQQYIDELTGMGVENIVVMSHYQYRNDLVLAENLSGVDVIVGGDSHTLLGSNLENFGLNPAGEYPTVTTDKDGNTVCVVQAWQYSNVVGELDINFNADGTVASCSGTPHVLLGDSFRRKNEAGDRVELEGDARSAVIADVDGAAELSIVTPDANAETVLSSYATEVEVLETTVVGTAEADLCFERIPGQGRSAICDVTETQSNGSDISNIVAKAFREMSITSDIAIQNGGGVRTDIAQGDITIGDAYLLLPFANTLVELDMTGAEISQVLEEAITYALNPEGSTGAYPYASGLRWDLDVSKPAGERFSHIEVKLKSDADWSPINAASTYKVVTNSFVAGGHDGYLTFGTVSDDNRALDTYLDYAQSFVDYVKAEGSITKLPLEEYSTQSYTNADGVLQ